MCLLARLGYAYGYRQGLAAAPKARAAHRRGPKIMQTDRHPHIRIGVANAIGWIETDPSQVLDMRLSPGVPRFLRGHAIDAVEVTSDVPRRNAERSRCCNKDMGDVLTNATPKRKRFCGGGCSVGRIGVESNFTI